MSKKPSTTTRNEVRDERSQFTRSAQIRGSTVDEANRSVEVVLASETPATVFDRKSYSVIDEVLRMDGCVLPAQVPMLADHDQFSIESVRGSIRDLRVDGDKIVGRAYFASDADSLRAFTKVKEGHLTDVSVGYDVSDGPTIPAGQRQTVGGKEYTAGKRNLRITTRWRPKEGSLVPIGADPASKIREDQTETTTRATGPIKESTMNFIAWLKARGLDHDKLTEAQRSALKADFDGEVARAAAAVESQAAAGRTNATDAGAPAGNGATRAAGGEIVTPLVGSISNGAAESEAARADGMRLERERTVAIRAEGEGVDPALVNRAITDGWTVERAAREFLGAIRAARGDGRTGTGARVEVGAAGEDKFMRAVETSLMQRAGFRVADPAAVAEAAHMRAAGLQDIARLALRAHRLEVPVAPEALLRAAAATFSFPTALGNTLYRVLQTAYQESPSTILQWASRMDVQDFRTASNIKMGKFAQPSKVGKGGEINYGTLSEEAENFSADTYGVRFAITRKDFINDDLGLFTRIPTELGMAMKRNIDDIGYTLLIAAAGVGPTMLADNTAMFNASRGDGSNYATGAGSVLGSAGLSGAKQLMRKIKQTGVPLNLMPFALLVPPELEQTAMEFIHSQQIVISQAGSTDASSLRGASNIHFGTLTPIVEPRLSAATNGATAWYLIADRATAAKSLAVSFLRGVETPTVERVDPTDVLGIGWLAYHDVGVSAVDWRGIQRNKGA